MLPLIPLALALAPYLTRVLAGDRAGAAAEAVAGAVQAVTGTDDPAQAEAVLAGDPAAREALGTRLAEIALEQERIAAADRADARQMARGGGPLAWGAGLVTAAVTALFAFACVAVIGGWASIDEGGGAALLLGALIAAFADVRGFWTGSSAGSAAKSGLIGDGGGPFGQGRG